MTMPLSLRLSTPGRALSVLAAFSLCACAQLGAPPPDTPATPPAQWDAATPDLAANDDQLARWWSAFGQPELDRLILQALARNTDLRIAQATLREARAARAATQAAAGPLLDLGGSASRSRVDGGTDSRSYQLGFSASWEPDLWGAQGAGVQAAQADEAAAQADLHSTRMSLVAEVGLAYIGWRDAQAREQITRASLASLEETQALVRWNLQAGLASTQAWQQAVLATEQTRASLATLGTSIAQYRHQLALLTGQSPAALSRQVAESGPVPGAEAALQTLAVGVPADLLRRRPDLISAEAAVKAAWLRREQSRRAGWPGLSLSGTLGVQAATLGALGQPGAALATLAASLDGVLWDGGQHQALVEQKDAALARSTAAYDAAVLGAVRDADDALAALRGSRDRATALHLAAEAAERSMLLSRHQRQAGLIDVSTLLEAQRTELSALLALQGARSELNMNLIRVWKALGGGWRTDALAGATSDDAHTP